MIFVSNFFIVPASKGDLLLQRRFYVTFHRKGFGTEEACLKHGKQTPYDSLESNGDQLSVSANKKPEGRVNFMTPEMKKHKLASEIKRDFKTMSIEDKYMLGRLVWASIRLSVTLPFCLLLARVIEGGDRIYLNIKEKFGFKVKNQIDSDDKNMFKESNHDRERDET